LTTHTVETAVRSLANWKMPSSFILEIFPNFSEVKAS